MRVMIAGADTSTVNKLASHLTDCGHGAKITRNGLECLAALQVFTPDLLILEFGILWGGGAGVMAVMDGDPDLANVPVVLFADNDQHPEFRKHPRIVARLTRRVQPCELSGLNGLLVNIATICGVARFPGKRMGQFADSPKSMSTSHRGEGGSIRQAAFMVPSISASLG